MHVFVDSVWSQPTEHPESGGPVWPRIWIHPPRIRHGGLASQAVSSAVGTRQGSTSWPEMVTLPEIDLCWILHVQTFWKLKALHEHSHVPNKENRKWLYWVYLTKAPECKNFYLFFLRFIDFLWQIFSYNFKTLSVHTNNELCVIYLLFKLYAVM